VFEIYAYGNVDTLTGIFNAIAAIMGGADYFGLIRTIAVTGVLVAAAAGLFTPGRFHGWAWFMGFMLLYHALFLPKVDVVIVDKLGGQAPVAVGNVPIGIAFFGHSTSKIGDVLTRLFETAFQVIPAPDAQLPNELTYQKNGVLFGNRLIQASRNVNIATRNSRPTCSPTSTTARSTICRTAPSIRRSSREARTSGPSWAIPIPPASPPTARRSR
jgi:conjugal transfer mating pair stabilization protein TraG